MEFNIISILAGAAFGAACGAVLARQGLLQKVARLEAERDALENSGKALETRFENLANRIFEEKTEKFKRDSQEGLGVLLAPLRERLSEFQKKVEDSFGAQAKEQFSLKKEIESIVLVNQQMTRQTESLTRALKGDVKAQGNWGEIMLEKILEDSGLRKGEDYILQGADMGLTHAEDGSRLKPDVIVKLPEGKHVIIDAKVSLTSYERYCSGADDAARAPHLKDFVASVRAHVAGLGQRRYQDTEKLGAPDFVLMFMAVEGAYALAVQQDAELHAMAWDKKIVIVCPSTLFATLKTIASVWRIELQNRHALEIARQGGNLYDKVAGFVEDMQVLGKRIGSAADAYDDAFKKLSTGPGNIIKRTEDIRALGVKASKKITVQADGDEAEPAAAIPLKKAENS